LYFNTQYDAQILYLEQEGSARCGKTAREERDENKSNMRDHGKKNETGAFFFTEQCQRKTRGFYGAQILSF
jgi:hypothetical protein